MKIFGVSVLAGVFLFVLGVLPVYAVPCDPPQSGNYTLPQSCTFDSNSVGIHGIRTGNLIVPAGVTLTINAGQTIYWPQGYSIQMTGGSIVMNSTATMKQGDVTEAYLQALGFDAYASALPVKVFSNNLFVCTSDPCVATSPAGNGNVIVEGKVKITGGSPGVNKVLTSDAAGEASWQAGAGGIPSGMIAPFDAACPTGWTEYAAAQGRYIVGLPSGGTLSGTAGTALTNLENRAVGQHTHTITDPGHLHGPGTLKHMHGWNVTGGSSGSVSSDSLGAATGGMSGNTASNTTGITIANSGTVAGTNAPYVQLRWCKKD